MKTLYTVLAVLGIAILIDAFFVQGVAGFAGGSIFLIIGGSYHYHTKNKKSIIPLILYVLQGLSWYGAYTIAQG